MFLKSVNIIYVLCCFYEAREPFNKSLSLTLDIIMHCGGGVLALGHFQFRAFQLNKIIGFSPLPFPPTPIDPPCRRPPSEFYEKTFILEKFSYIPPKFYTSQSRMQPYARRKRSSEKKVMIKF